MAWYPGKRLFGAIGRGINRQQDLKQRGMDVPAPTYDAGTMGAFQGAAASGAGALGSARGAQTDALGMYRDMASGQGPSVAQAQLAQQNASNVANQQAMAAQGRGGNLASMQRQAAGAGAAGAMAGQQQLADLRAQEVQAAMAGAAGLSSTMADQGLQQQMGALGLQGAAAGQQLGSSTQWGLGQRGMDIQQLQGNRENALGWVGALGQTAANIGGLV